MAYRIKGASQDVVQCDQCGRDDLKKTVVLQHVDSDGNLGEIVHMGTDCAARATRRSQQEVRRLAAEGDVLMDAADQRQARYAAALADYRAHGTAIVQLGPSVLAGVWGPEVLSGGSDFNTLRMEYGQRDPVLFQPAAFAAWLEARIA